MVPPLCSCRVRKSMRSSAFINGCFVWQGFFCPTCHSGTFTSKTQAWGYRVTRLLVNETEVMCRGGDEQNQGTWEGEPCT